MCRLLLVRVAAFFVLHSWCRSGIAFRGDGCLMLFRTFF
uniref:Trp-operon Leader Peptide n=1 Tax=Siphoviridae sp. ctrpM6 TaxID=2827956 RepID=A0A8S5T5G0_9CAUD|nr:MAG TPA: Trp-operon Leader Peptide [Siphoviridae sp. ctrpM6]